MPIVIPTAGEIQRMDQRQKAAYAKRLPATRQHLADSINTLATDLPDLFPTGRDLALARRRAKRLDPVQEVQRARILLAEMPPDPDAAEHVAELLRWIT